MTHEQKQFLKTAVLFVLTVIAVMIVIALDA